MDSKSVLVFPRRGPVTDPLASWRDGRGWEGRTSGRTSGTVEQQQESSTSQVCMRRGCMYRGSVGDAPGGRAAFTKNCALSTRKQLAGAESALTYRLLLVGGAASFSRRPPSLREGCRMSALPSFL